MELSKFMTAKEATVLTEHAKNKMYESEEFTQVMKNLQEQVLKAAEKGSTDTQMFCGFVDNICNKFDPYVFVNMIADNWITLGYKVNYSVKDRLIKIYWN